MGMIKCCGRLQKAQTFRLENKDGFHNIFMKRLVFQCPECSARTIQLERSYYVYDKETKTILDEITETTIKTKNDADKVFQKYQSSIVYEIKRSENVVCGKFYLPYNEYGKKKKCYSNLSTLKMGLTENKDFYNKDLIAV